MKKLPLVMLWLLLAVAAPSFAETYGLGDPIAVKDVTQRRTLL